MVRIIPMPLKQENLKGSYLLNTKNIRIFINDSLMSALKLDVSFTLCNKESADIRIELSQGIPPSGYTLEVSKNGIDIYAGDCEGAFYALSSLKQLVLLSERNNGSARLFLLRIEDSPRYEWRGLHLDESRHFFGKETVKKLLDFMSLYKLNRFHWHLTDDHGWRIEIEKYPLLTEKGSYRKGSQLHHWTSTQCDDIEVSGYYTKDDIREIVAYAKERYIEIVPEIDFPAHTAAAISCYKELSCNGKDGEIFNFFGGKIPYEKGMKDWNRPICLGKDSALDFVYDVLGEVCELFPFEFFHVGGDEAPTEQWKKCPLCQKRIKEEGLKDEVALQGWFTNKVNNFLRSKGKKMIGWNEILASGIADSTIVAQYWTPKKDKNVVSHLEKGGKAILSCHKHFYFDMNYTYCKVKGTYSFTPEKANIKGSLKNKVLGLEAEIWTEFIKNEDELFFKLWHRGLALSENCWTKEKSKNYADFLIGLQQHKPLADKMQWYYGKDEFTVDSSPFRNKKLSRKYGLNRKYFDTEYILSKK